MDRKVGMRICEVGMYAQQDPDHRRLLEEYRMRDEELKRALKKMDRRQKDAVLDYCGVMGQLYLKMMECACTLLVEAEQSSTRE